MAFTGDIETIPIASILQLLSTENKTGILSVKSFGIEFQIFFKDGAIIHAIEPHRESRLGVIMLNEGVISKETYEECLKLALKRKKALGKILVEDGYVLQDKLTECIYKQIQEIIFSMLCFTSGEFEFVVSNYNTKWIVPVKMNTLQLVLDGLRRLDDN